MWKSCVNHPPKEPGEYEIDIPGVMGFDGIFWDFDGVNWNPPESDIKWLPRALYLTK